MIAKILCDLYSNHNVDSVITPVDGDIQLEMFDKESGTMLGVVRQPNLETAFITLMGKFSQTVKQVKTGKIRLEDK